MADKKRKEEQKAYATGQSVAKTGVWMGGNKGSAIAKSSATPQKQETRQTNQNSNQNEQNQRMNAAQQSEAEWAKNNKFHSGWNSQMKISQEAYNQAMQDSKNYGLKGTVQKYYNSDPRGDMMQNSREAEARAIKQHGSGNSPRANQESVLRNRAGERQTRGRQQYGTADLGTRNIDQQLSNPYLYVADFDPFPAETTYAQDRQAQLRTDKRQSGNQGGSMPSLLDYELDPFPVSNEYVDKPFLSREDKKNNYDALDTAWRAANETASGVSGLRSLSKALLGLGGDKEKTDALVDSLVNGYRQMKAEEDYASLPIAGFKPDYSNTDQLYEEHPTAKMIGDMAGKMAQYGMVNAAAEAVPAVGNVVTGLANKLGGGRIATNVAKALVDWGITDLPLTEVEKIANDIHDGKSAGEVALNALKEAGIDVGMNLAFGAPEMIGGIISDYKNLPADMEGILGDENLFRMNGADGTVIPEAGRPGRTRTPRGSASDLTADYLAAENEMLREGTKNVQPQGPKKPPYYNANEMPSVENPVAEQVAKSADDLEPVSSRSYYDDLLEDDIPDIDHWTVDDFKNADEVIDTMDRITDKITALEDYIADEADYDVVKKVRKKIAELNKDYEEAEEILKVFEGESQSAKTATSAVEAPKSTREQPESLESIRGETYQPTRNQEDLVKATANSDVKANPAEYKKVTDAVSNKDSASKIASTKRSIEEKQRYLSDLKRRLNKGEISQAYYDTMSKRTKNEISALNYQVKNGGTPYQAPKAEPEAPATSDTDARIQALTEQLESLKKQLQGQTGEAAETVAKETEIPKTTKTKAKAEAPKTAKPQTDTSGLSDSAQKRVAELDDEIESLKERRRNGEISTDEFKTLRRKANQEKYALLEGKVKADETPVAKAETPKTEAPKTEAPKAKSKPETGNGRVKEIEAEKERLKERRANKELTDSEYRAERKKLNQELYQIEKDAKKAESAKAPKAPKAETSKPRAAAESVGNGKKAEVPESAEEPKLYTVSGKKAKNGRKKVDTSVEMPNVADTAKEITPPKAEAPAKEPQMMPNVNDTAKELSDADALKKAKSDLREMQGEYAKVSADLSSMDVDKTPGNVIDAANKRKKELEKAISEQNKLVNELDAKVGTTTKKAPTGRVKATLNPTEAPDAGTIADGAKSADKVMDNLDDMAKEIDEGNGSLKKNSYSNKTVQKTNLAKEKPEVADHFIDNPQFYRAITNDETSKAANKIMEKPFDEAYNDFLDLLSKKDPVSLPLGIRLCEVADTPTAVNIVSQMSSELTKAGQFTQAAAIELLKNNPMATMGYLQKQLDKLNDICNSKFRNFEKRYGKIALTDEEVKAFKAIKPGDEEALKELSEQISDRIAKDLPVTLGEKAKELRKLAMLLNPKTHVRNVVSNVASIPLSSASDRVEALMQNIWAKTGGKKSGFQVTQSLTGGSKEVKKGIADSGIFEERFRPLLDKASTQEWKEGLTSNAILDKRQIFKDSKIGTKAKEYTLKLANGTSQKVQVSDVMDKLTGGKLKEVLENLPETVDEKMAGSILENLRQADYWMLGALEDDPFVKKRFVNRLASYLDAQGFKEFPDLAKLTGDELKAFDNATEVAWDEALKATFKDNNFMTKGLGGLKKGLNDISGGTLGEIIFPFVKTPANIAKRALEYSPAGILRAIMNGASGKGAESVMNALAKATTGSGLIALAYLLKKEGIITGNLSDNKDAASFQKQQGKLPYSININGRGVTFDWLQPAAVPFIIGATIADAIDESDKHWYELAGDAAVAATDSWADISPLQSFKDLFKTDRATGDVSLGRNLLDIALGTPNSFIPSLAGAIARAGDNVYRNTYSKADSTIKDKWNEALAKTPGASKTLPEQYTTWGDVRTRAESDGLNALQQFILPGQIGNDQSHPQDETISDLYDMTGSEAVFPHKAEWTYTINGEKVKLTGKQQSTMQKVMGKLSDKLAQQLIFKDSDYFNSLSYDDRSDALGKLMNFAEAVAKMDVLGNDITKSSEYNRLYSAYVKDGARGVIEQLKLEGDLKKYGYDMSDSKAVTAAQEGNLDEFHEQDQALKDLGYTWGSTKAVEALENGGIESLYDYNDVQQHMEQYGLSNRETYDYLGNKYDDYAGLVSGSSLHDTKKNAETYDTYGAESLRVAGEADANGNNDGSYTKAEVMRYWLSQGYSESEINQMLQSMFGYAKASKKDWANARG